MRWSACLVIVLLVVLGGCSSSTASTSTPADSPDPAPAGTPTAQALCLSTINSYRAMASLPAYGTWDDIDTCSYAEANSDGSTKIAHGAFGQCGESAQNECPGWPAPAEGMIASCLMEMFAEGPGGGHYDSIMSTKYTKVSCGFATAADGTIWAVQNFQ